MRTKEQYEAELKRLLDLKESAELAVKNANEVEEPEKYRVAIKKFKKAEQEYTKLLDEYLEQYSKI